MTYWVASLCLLVAVCSATSPPARAEAHFCADMLDQTLLNGTVQPHLTFSYKLCIDIQSKSWRRTDPMIGTLIFNGTNLITIGRKGCSVAPPTGGDPTKGLPFTLLTIDPAAISNGTGTIDGVLCV